MSEFVGERGGNGRQTSQQKFLLGVLGDEWIGEFPVSTGRKGDGWPPCYKIDIANPETKQGIELDGRTHGGRRLLRDAQKMAYLKELGWAIVNIKNIWVDVCMMSSTSTRSKLEYELRQVGITLPKCGIGDRITEGIG